MSRTLACLILGVASFLGITSTGSAQTDLFHKAPPQVEQALRERVTKFYQAHVDAKFRQADIVVAEESKDQFFGMAKPVYRAFEILRITYTEDFSKANVATVVERDMNLRGNKFPVKAPVTSTWKVIEGQWFWYVDEQAGKQAETPMGTMHAGPQSERPPGMPADFAQMINDPKRRAELAASIRTKVAVNKTEVTLPLDKPGSETIEISNGLEGPIKIEMEMQGMVQGLTARVDSVDVAGGGKTLIRLKYVPGAKTAAKPSAGLVIHVAQTAQVFNVAIRFGSAQ